MSEERVLWFVSKMKNVIERLHRDMGAGMSLSIAVQMAYHDIDQAYRQLCGLDKIQPINHMLEPTSVEMCARFALDALFGALKGELAEPQAREAFWQSFRRATQPTLLAKTKPR